MWCIQEITPEYRKRMYKILDLYKQQYNPLKPVLGIDEKPKQLIGEKRKPLPMKKGKIEKYDYEYIRNGTANIFMSVEPKGGKRHTQVTRQRTGKDFALYLKWLVLKKYAKAKKIKIVIDNLNTHKPKWFYEHLPKEIADQIIKKVEFYYTPKHASWLNVAEIEIGIMDSQCTGKRINDFELLQREVKSWEKRRNKSKAKINWTFTKQKADKKLSKHYTE